MDMNLTHRNDWNQEAGTREDPRLPQGMRRAWRFRSVTSDSRVESLISPCMARGHTVLVPSLPQQGRAFRPPGRWFRTGGPPASTHSEHWPSLYCTARRSLLRPCQCLLTPGKRRKMYKVTKSCPHATSSGTRNE